MKLTNRQIIQAIDALNELVDTKMPVELTYQTIDATSELMQKYNIYLTSLERVKGEYGEKTDAFDAEIQKLLEIETEIFIPSFKRRALVESGIELTPAQLIRLRPLIEEVDDG